MGLVPSGLFRRVDPGSNNDKDSGSHMQHPKPEGIEELRKRFYSLIGWTELAALLADGEVKWLSRKRR